MGKSEVPRNYRKELIQYFNKLSAKYSAWKAFSDFVEVAAIAIQNSIKPPNFDELEQRYLTIINEYDREEQFYFQDMFALLVCELQKQVESGKVVDVLGEIFHELELHNKYKGQFFTPNHIAEFMGQITICDYADAINENGFVTVSEPCSGGGAMIFGFAKAMLDNGYSYNTQMVVSAIDIDLKCVFMTYVQCALYGIPAVVVHGNSLSLEEWSKWHTPVYFWDMWYLKKQKEVVKVNKNAETKDLDPMKSKIGNQISLF